MKEIEINECVQATVPNEKTKQKKKKQRKKTVDEESLYYFFHKGK